MDINGLKRTSAARKVNGLIRSLTKGLFTDDDWCNVTRVFKGIESEGLDLVILGTQYTENREGNPNSKTWAFEVTFLNNNDRKTTLFGTLVASGAGSVSDPLGKYDIVAYVS